MSPPRMTMEEMNIWRLNHMKEVQQNFRINQLCLGVDSENKEDFIKLAKITMDLSNLYSVDYLGKNNSNVSRYCNQNGGNPIIIDLNDDENDDDNNE